MKPNRPHSLLLTIYIAALVCSVGIVQTKTNSNKSPDSLPISLPLTKKRKTILVFTCDGGGGHRSASRSLFENLGKTHNILEISTLKRVLAGNDPLRTLSFGKYNCEDFYNYLLKKQHVWLMNNLSRFGKKAIKLRNNYIEKQFNLCIDRYNPDMIISVLPHLNKPLYTIAEQKNIPFLVLTNDLDTTNYIPGLKKPTYKNFKYSLAFDDSEIRKKIAKAQIPEEAIEILGFPIRKDFYEHKPVKNLHKKLQIDTDKPTVMIMMGAHGSGSLYKYTKELSRIKRPLNLLVCCGRNKEVQAQIEKLKIHKKTNPDVTIRPIGFTKHISHLMRASHLVITKPGPSSICEALYSNTPVLLDDTSKHISWERLNLRFVKKHKLGDLVSSYKQTRPLVEKYITDHNYYKSIKNNMSSLEKPHYLNGIKSLVDRMLKQESKKEPIKA